jgi:hypothetical protein
MKKLFLILVIFLIYLPFVRSQGLTNNGTYIKITSGTVIRITGTKGNFVNNKNGTLNGKVKNDGKIFVQGNWTNNADAGNLFISRNTLGEVILYGTSTQNITGSQVTNFESLRINNTSVTSPQIVMLTNTFVDNQLKMVKGNINLSGQTLTLGKTATLPGTLSHAGLGANGWMYGGNFKRYFKTAVIANRNIAGMFPLGSAVDFRPFYISHPVTAFTSGGTITLSHTSSPTVSDVNYPDGTSTVIRRSDSYWTCSTGGGMTAAGTPFNLSGEGTGFGLITDITNLRLTLFGSIKGTAGTNGGTILEPRISRTGLKLVDLANKFYPASVNMASPLPIELVSFDAICKPGKVDLIWTTATETNNNFFTIYKSPDAENWIELGSIDGAGNSNMPVNYSSTDENYQGGIAYYKLKQTDFDGKSAWFNVVFANCNSVDEAIVLIYPNPFTSFITITINDASILQPYELRMFNYLGSEVLKTNIAQPITTIAALNLPSGLYTYVVMSHNKTIQSGKLISQ